MGILFKVTITEGESRGEKGFNIFYGSNDKPDIFVNNLEEVFPYIRGHYSTYQMIETNRKCIECVWYNCYCRSEKCRFVKKSCENCKFNQQDPDDYLAGINKYHCVKNKGLVLCSDWEMK